MTEQTVDISAFENSEIPFIELMANIVPLVIDDVYYARLCEDLSRVNNFDIDYLGYVDIAYVDYHWGDILGCLTNHDHGNLLNRLILLTFCQPNDFTFKTNYTNGYDYKQYGYKFEVGDHYADESIRRWFNDEFGDFFDENDDFLNEYIDISAEVLVFKNKSIGRKIKKLYRNNLAMRTLFNELGYTLKNGRFVLTCWIDSEAYDPVYGSFNITEIVESVKAVRKILKIKNVHRNLENLAFSLERITDVSGYEWSDLGLLMDKIMNLNQTKKEIIL